MKWIEAAFPSLKVLILPLEVLPARFNQSPDSLSHLLVASRFAEIVEGILGILPYVQILGFVIGSYRWYDHPVEGEVMEGVKEWVWRLPEELRKKVVVVEDGEGSLLRSSRQGKRGI